MGVSPKVVLRSVIETEQDQLQRIVKASSERVDVVRRAKALLAVSAGSTFTQAGRQAGMGRQAVSQLVERFNQRGMAALLLAAGRGRKATYTPHDRERILQEVQRQPDREQDQTATWSLSTLQRALRKQGLPHISRDTIGQVLHEAGCTYQRSRTWCPTGTALRVRKEGVVTVHLVPSSIMHFNVHFAKIGLRNAPPRPCYNVGSPVNVQASLAAELRKSEIVGGVVGNYLFSMLRFVVARGVGKAGLCRYALPLSILPALQCGCA